MRFFLDEPFKITTEFWESRPLSVDYNNRNHPHAAWDVVTLNSTPYSTPILAPEKGNAFYFFALRQPNQTIPRILWGNGIPFPFSHYTYDIYGGLIVLEGKSGYTHLFTHCFINQIFNWDQINRNAYTSVELKNKLQFPSVIFHTLKTPRLIEEGDILGHIGDAGYSSGPHVHYEIHKGKTFYSYLGRPDPIELFPNVWELHKSDLIYDWMKEKQRWS